MFVPRDFDVYVNLNVFFFPKDSLVVILIN